MSKKIEAETLKIFVSQYPDKVFITKHREKKFMAALVEDRVEVTPLSSGKSRYESDRTLEKILDHFNLTQSFQSKDYKDITFNSVYVLTIIEAYLNQK